MRILALLVFIFSAEGFKFVIFVAYQSKIALLIRKLREINYHSILKTLNMVFITRRERFSAAHRLFNAEWTDEKNAEVFGPCSNPLWHGHNYVMWVTVKGDMNPQTGYVCDLKELATIIKEKVIEKVDHKNLNLEVDFLKDKIISTENLAVSFWNQLEQPVKQMGVELHSVKIEETENNYVEYFGN